jgi:ABC transport system ATP-binding/permease protein
MAPPLTVYLGSAMYTFPGGREVTVGRADTSDIRVEATQRQAISRTHLVLRYEGGEWLAIDKSRNGIYVDGARVSTVPVDDDRAIAVGDPTGPRLTFRLSTQVIRPMTTPPPTARQPVPQWRPPAPPQRAPRPPRGPVAAPPPAPRRPPVPPPAQVRTVDEDVLSRMTGAVKKVLPQRSPVTPPGATAIGRAAGNAIVVDDALASRLHAYLVPTPAGIEIRDNRSSNGTFVNGRRVTAVVLRPDDVVTIGNTDFTFTGTTLAARTAAPDTVGLSAQQLGLVVDGRPLCSQVSFSARPGTLTAVIGPSGAGKSTLIKLLGGASRPSSGWVSFDGHDVHAGYASLRSRIGMVPQDDVVHRQLTVERALSYAAELRLPPDTTAADRHAVVQRVLGELELTEHRDKRVDKLSGGQRKRVSVAMELLTGPSLLILDEPTSGLDPSLDRQVMGMLRRLADAGRVVVVVTHSLTYLSMCDQVLLLAPGGKTAFAGPPAQVASVMGTTDWADIFAWVSTDPDGAHRAFLSRHPGAAHPAGRPAPTGEVGEPAHTSRTRQVSTVARRQVRLIVSDRGYFIFLAVLPFILGALSLVVPGNVGLGVAQAHSSSPNEPDQLLILLNIAAVFMGTALSIRDLVSERPIFCREQAVGLSASAYLAAKIAIYSAFAAVQVAVLTAIVVVGKGGPARGSVLLGDPVFELYVTLAVTAIVSAVLGLLLSSLARTTDWILPMLVVVIMLSIVFSGGMIPVSGRIGLDQLSWFLPARWGFAASASTVDLLTASPLLTTDDPLWRHAPGWWALDVGVLVLLGVVCVALVGYRLRLPAGERGAAASAGSGVAAVEVSRRRGMPGWVAAACAVVAVVVFVGALSYATRGSGTRAAPDLGFPNPTQTQGPAPSQQPVAPGAVPELLLTGDRLSTIVDPAMAGLPLNHGLQPVAGTAAPPQCLGAVDPANEGTYGSSGFTAIAVQNFTDPAGPLPTVTESVATFPSADAAAAFEDRQNTDWMDCQNKTVTFTGDGAPPVSVNVGAAQTRDGVLSVVLQRPDIGASCQRALNVNSNVVIDVKVCATKAGGTQAEQIATQIAEKIK